jgi:hypothetical protein
MKPSPSPSSPGSFGVGFFIGMPAGIGVAQGLHNPLLGFGIGLSISLVI